jgi:hypothetical protein
MTTCLHCKTDVQNCKQTKCVNKFCTENNFIFIEMIFWHNLQIKITTETEDILCTDSTFCGDMAIWEQETGVLYQVAVYQMYKIVNKQSV